MRPDRIIVGECRGAEALDMLQAMNTGHDGSMTTVHANSPRDAFSRLETMVMMASQHVPDKVIRQQLASAINIVVHSARLSDGTRKVTGIGEVLGVDGDQVEMQDIFTFERTGISTRGKVLGSFRATGNQPVCLERLKAYGIHLSHSIFARGARGEGKVRGWRESYVLLDRFPDLRRARSTRPAITFGRFRSGRPRRCSARRLRELRANVRSRAKGQPELLRQQRRGTFAALGDFVAWIGILRRLQAYIEQANLKYRAAEVFRDFHRYLHHRSSCCSAWRACCSFCAC